MYWSYDNIWQVLYLRKSLSARCRKNDMVLYVLTNGIVEIMPRYLKIITKEFFFIVHSRCSQHICTSKANSIYTELERMSFHLHLGYKEIIHYFILCSYCISNAPSLTGLILKVHSCPCRKFHFPLGVSYLSWQWTTYSTNPIFRFLCLLCILLGYMIWILTFCSALWVFMSMLWALGHVYKIVQWTICIQKSHNEVYTDWVIWCHFENIV